MKKVAILASALLIFGMSACSVKTCPTYSKKEIKEVRTDRVRV